MLAMALMFVFSVSTSFAGESDVLLRILIKKGIISEAEYQDIKKELAEAVKESDTAKMKEDIKKEVIAEVEKKKETDTSDWARRIKLSGTLQGEYRWMKHRDRSFSANRYDPTSDLYVRKAEIGIDSNITDWLTASMVLNSEWIGDSLNNGNEQITVDKAILTFKKEGIPVYAVIGKRTQPFGAFFSHLATDPMTQDAYETKRTGLTLGVTGPMDLDLSGTIYKGEQQMTHLFASNLFDTTNIRRASTTVPNSNPAVPYVAGAEVTDDLNSYIFAAQITPFKDHLTVGVSYLSEPGHQKRNATLGTSLKYNCYFLKGLTLEAEYIVALNRERYWDVNVTNALFTSAFKEKVLVVGAAYQIIDPVEFAVRYEDFDDGGMADKSGTWSVDNRYSIGGTYTFYRDEKRGLSAFITPEYRHTNFRLHSIQKLGMGNSNDEVFFRVGVNF